MRWIDDGKAVERGGESTSQRGRFETEVPAIDDNLAAHLNEGCASTLIFEFVGLDDVNVSAFGLEKYRLLTGQRPRRAWHPLPLY